MFNQIRSNQTKASNKILEDRLEGDYVMEDKIKVLEERNKQLLIEIQSLKERVAIAQQMSRDILNVLGLSVVQQQGQMHFQLNMPNKKTGYRGGILSNMQVQLNDLKQRTGNRIILPN